jgi:hypothetical protein
LNLEWELDVVEDCPPGQQAEGLEDETGMWAWRGLSVAVDEDLASVWLEEPVDDSQQSRFAAPRWPDEADEFARHNLQRHIPQSRNSRMNAPPYAVEGLGYMPDIDFWGSHATPTGSGFRVPGSGSSLAVTATQLRAF